MSTRVGIDGRKIPESALRGPVGSLSHAAELGVDGLFFRTVLDMSPTLDPGHLREIRQHADSLGLYLETGLGKVNPYATPEAPELRAIGDGDILRGFTRMMEACAAIDCRELWIATANYKPQYKGYLAYDRFRTDVEWTDQLQATERFLRKLAPIAKDLDIHLNLETHEEITSFEIVSLIERVGADAIGVVYDTANVLQRAEHPIWAAQRLAPYVRQTHIKDALLVFANDGVEFQLRPCGDGVVDFAQIIPILLDANPNLNLSIENAEYYPDQNAPFDSMRIDLFDATWLAGHPDLSKNELAAYTKMILDYEQKIAAGEQQSIGEYLQRPYDFEAAVAQIKRSVAHIRSCVADYESRTIADLASVPA